MLGRSRNSWWIYDPRSYLGAVVDGLVAAKLVIIARMDKMCRYDKKEPETWNDPLVKSIDDALRTIYNEQKAREDILK